jgi:hypothetical protein
MVGKNIRRNDLIADSDDYTDDVAARQPGFERAFIATDFRIDACLGIRW